MENYIRARTEELPAPCPFSGLPPDTPQVRVRDGSKIRNLLRFALSRLEGAGPPGAGPKEAQGAGPRGAGPRAEADPTDAKGAEPPKGQGAGPTGPRAAQGAGPRTALEADPTDAQGAGPTGPRAAMGAGPKGAGPKAASDAQGAGPMGPRTALEAAAMGAGPRAASEAQQGERAAPGQQGAAGCRQLVLVGSGRGVAKAVSLVELVKRRVAGLQQLTRLLYGAVREVWEPREPAAGLDSLTVSRRRPAVWILLSRDPLDSREPGFQAPGRHGNLWDEPRGNRPQAKRKRGGGEAQRAGERTELRRVKGGKTEGKQTENRQKTDGKRTLEESRSLFPRRIFQELKGVERKSNRLCFCFIDPFL
ncbi:uncharacterized protein ACNS7B_024503 [Menidia menidia]